MSAPKALLAPLLLLLLLLACGAARGSSSGSKAAAPTSSAAAASSSASSSPASSSPSSSSNDWCLPGLECPRFDLLEVAERYQVRRYEPAAWAVTVVRRAPSLQAAQLVGLARLSRYWRGDNDRGRPLPPTAPLVTALFPTKGGGGGGDAWSAEGVFVVAAPLPASEAHFPPRPLRQRWCPWGDPDAGAHDGNGCRVRMFRSGDEGGCRNDDGDDGNEKGGEAPAWLAEAVDALVMAAPAGEGSGDAPPVPPPDTPQGDGDDEGEGEDDDDDPPCFLDGPNGDCSEEEEEEEEEEEDAGGGKNDDAPSSSSSSSPDDPNRRRKRRRHRARGTVVYASERFDGFPTERDALARARELRLALRADRRPYCRRVFFLAAYSPPWQLLGRRNEVWAPSCARRRRRGNEDGGGDGPVVSAS